MTPPTSQPRALLAALLALAAGACFEPLDFDAVRPVCEAPAFDAPTRDQYCSGTFELHTSATIPNSVLDLDALGDTVLVTSGMTATFEGLTVLKRLDAQTTPRASLFLGEEGALDSAPTVIAESSTLPESSLPTRFGKLVYEDPPVAAFAVGDRLALVEIKDRASPTSFPLPERTLFAAGFPFDLALYPPQDNRVDALIALGPAGIKPAAFERKELRWGEEQPNFSANSAEIIPVDFCQEREDQESQRRCLALCPTCALDADDDDDDDAPRCRKCLLDHGAFFYLGDLRHAYSLAVATPPQGGPAPLFVGSLGHVLRYDDAGRFLASRLTQEIKQGADLIKGYEPDEVIALSRPQGAPPGLIVTAARVEDEGAYFVAQDSMLWGINAEGAYEGSFSFTEELGAAYLYAAPRDENGALGSLRAVELPEGLRSAERVAIAPVSPTLVAVRGLRSRLLVIEDASVRQGHDPVLALVDLLDPSNPVVVWTDEREGTDGEHPLGLLAYPPLERLLLPEVEQTLVYDASVKGGQLP